MLTHREQAPLVKGWIEQRFDTLMPNLMTRTGIDMWIIVSREYNDHPGLPLDGGGRLPDLPSAATVGQGAPSVTTRSIEGRSREHT